MKPFAISMAIATRSSFLFLLGLATTGCGSKKDVSISRSIGDGTYTVLGPSCISTGLRPPYPAPDRAAALLDFDTLTGHSWVISGGDLTITINDSDCQLALKRRISTNSSSVFAYTKEKIAMFAPESCEFAASGGGVTLPASKSLAQVFQDSSDTAVDLEFAVDRVDNELRLTTTNTEPLRSVWSSYGCTSPDALGYALVKLN